MHPGSVGICMSLYCNGHSGNTPTASHCHPGSAEACISHYCNAHLGNTSTCYRSHVRSVEASISHYYSARLGNNPTCSYSPTICCIYATNRTIRCKIHLSATMTSINKDKEQETVRTRCYELPTITDVPGVLVG